MNKDQTPGPAHVGAQLRDAEAASTFKVKSKKRAKASEEIKATLKANDTLNTIIDQFSQTEGIWIQKVNDVTNEISRSNWALSIKSINAENLKNTIPFNRGNNDDPFKEEGNRLNIVPLAIIEVGEDQKIPLNDILIALDKLRFEDDEHSRNLLEQGTKQRGLSFSAHKINDLQNKSRSTYSSILKELSLADDASQLYQVGYNVKNKMFWLSSAGLYKGFGDSLTCKESGRLKTSKGLSNIFSGENHYSPKKMIKALAVELGYLYPEAVCDINKQHNALVEQLTDQGMIKRQPLARLFKGEYS